MDIRKSFMNLSKAECHLVKEECLRNAKAKYDDALALANSGSYGSAVSFLVISLEESMKATILALDSCGFEFRHKISGIDSIFKNHRLRYYLGFILTLFEIFSNEFMYWLKPFFEDPEKMKSFKAEGPIFEKQVSDWAIRGMKQVNDEIDWFKNADFFRQSGLYVDFANEIKSPLKATKNEFDELKTRIDRFYRFHSSFLQIFDPERTPLFKNSIKIVKGILYEHQLYDRLSMVVKGINKQDSYTFEDLQAKLLEAIGSSSNNES